jgi:subtilisin family serine protease/Tol biopolymer transport system component
VEHIRERFPVRARRAAARQRMPDLSTVYKVTVPEDTDIRQLAAEYAADPAVEYAEPNYEYQLAYTPTEALFSSSGSWGQTFPDLWGLHNIDAQDAWDLASGAGVVVAVIDTGVGWGLPDIEGNLWTNPAEIPGNGIDDDGNGYIDDVHGFPYLMDDVGHGTHVAGIVAAAANNGGVVGVAWQAQVMVLKIFNSTGGGTCEQVSLALHYATAEGADVVNMSFGGYGDSLVVRDAVDFAAAHGLVLVAAAGNDAVDVKMFSPADLDPVIAVAAVDHLDQPSWFSNWGGKIELAAPGGGDAAPPRYEPYYSVLSLQAGPYDWRLAMQADNGEILQRLGGTSMAAPHVSGVAALILSRHPEFTAEQVRQALRNGADDLGPPGRDARYGFGRLNAANSVAKDQVAVARLPVPKHLSRLHGETITVEGTVQNPGGGTPSWQLLFGPQGQTGSVIASGTGEVDAGTLATLDTAPLDRGNYVLQLQVTGPSGESASDTVTFTRLASRPYIRQLSDQAGLLAGFSSLDPDAWTGDGEHVVWTHTPDGQSYRVLATELATGEDRAIAEFQFGVGLPPFFVPLAEAVISRDGSTVAFVGPEDMSLSNTSEDDRNFQLFVYDTLTGAAEQITNATGGTFGSIVALRITADGSRMAFLSMLPLDPTAEPGRQRQIFYWDRTSGSIHQVTNITPEQGAVSPAVISPGGDRLAFLSAADLDPTVGNPTAASQMFVYDISQGVFHQLTRYVASPVPHPGFAGTTQGLSGSPAFSPDGQTLAATLVTTTWVTVYSPLIEVHPSSIEATVLLFDATTGAATTLAAVPAVAIPTREPVCSYSFEGAPQFSPDGSYLYFQGPLAADPFFAPLPRFRCHGSLFPASGLFRYGLHTGSLQRITAFPAGAAAAPGGRLASLSELYSYGLDPEGADPVMDWVTMPRWVPYLLDPDTAGGVLSLKRGHLRQRGTGIDSFSLSGRLLQSAGTLPDPTANDVSVAVLSANGQIFRGTIPVGTMRGGNGRWTYSDSSAPDVTRLVLRSSDGIHYQFSAAGHAAGLFTAATSYVTVEIQVGPAVFSNAQTFRLNGRRWRYP